MNVETPEIARSITAAGIRTNYHDLGSGFPVLMIHGSGPGVSAWANWRLVMPEVAKRSRVIAPDMVGFGFTERPAGQRYDMDVWVDQAIGLLDALDIEKADLVGKLLRWCAGLGDGYPPSAEGASSSLDGQRRRAFRDYAGAGCSVGYEPSFEGHAQAARHLRVGSLAGE